MGQAYNFTRQEHPYFKKSSCVPGESTVCKQVPNTRRPLGVSTLKQLAV